MLSTIKDKLRAYRFKARIRARPLKLVVGASGIYDAGWVPSDVNYLDLLNASHWKRYFREESIDAVLAEHVWEHLTIEDGQEAAQRCFKYLRRGGYLRVAVPDGFHPDETYIAHVKPGGTGPGADDHKVLYNYVTFSRVFEQAGFQVRLLEYFDARGQFHDTDWNPADGKINRSKRFDERNCGGTLNYTSIILDACKASVV